MQFLWLFKFSTQIVVGIIVASLFGVFYYQHSVISKHEKTILVLKQTLSSSQKDVEQFAASDKLNKKFANESLAKSKDLIKLCETRLNNKTSKEQSYLNLIKTLGKGSNTTSSKNPTVIYRTTDCKVYVTSIPNNETESGTLLGILNQNLGGI